ncbi:substrate-binding domain-containing protein [Alkalispirochaeta alkalica]|uniref:substrate-binding domain-containing protein n=1 Tax=Alkalispirochaeta alkalica TaxID=46356 RepID=UPI0003705840|nr:substrate-binding domain-containing protein [Alkalispirochaeta alkalica]
MTLLIAGSGLLFAGGAGESRRGPVTEIPGAPAPFDGSTGRQLHIAHISYLQEGEFMQMYRAGVEAQAAKLGMRVTLLGRHNDAQSQANAVSQAINLGVDGIVIQHGLTETMVGPAQQALDAGIPVVAFDVDLENPRIPQIAQNDPQHGRNAIEAIVEDFNGQVDMAYVRVAGILPLDRRDGPIQEVVERESGVRIVAQTGTLESPISVQNASQATAVLRANPNIRAYLAPYDEFAKGIVLALEEMGRDNVKVYSIDISTQDIEIMTRPNSPWVMTSAVNPAEMGAVSVRALARLMAGERVPQDVLVEPMIFTSQMLIEAGAQNMEDIMKAFPAFATSSAARSSWMPR